MQQPLGLINLLPMKKIITTGRSFGSAVSLTRQQLKNVMGGVVPTTGRPKCKITTAPGHSSPGQYYYCTNTTPNECQKAADAWCAGNDSCADVDCPGATV